MEFLKRHYEKIILSVVLLGLAAAAAWLPFAINQSRTDLSNTTAGDVGQPKPFKPVNLAKYTGTLGRLKNPPTLDFSGEHNLFNPVLWKTNQSGLAIKVKSEAEALIITNISPLHLVLSFDRAAGNGFWIGVVRENDPKLKSKNIPKYGKVGDKTDLFTIREVKGSAEEPELILELNDTRERVSIGKGKPYKRVEGHAADIRCKVDNKVLRDVRANQMVVLCGESYKIIAITNNEVRVQAVSNQKQITLTWNAAR